MPKLHYSIVLANPLTGESSILCHGTTLEEAEEVVAALTPVHPGMQFRIVATDARTNCLVMRAGA